MISYHSTFSTPVGPFSVAVDDTGALIATAFGNVAALNGRLPGMKGIADEARTRVVRQQVTAYFSGAREQFSLRLAPRGSEFQHRVWAALAEIPFGATRSYGELARRLGSSARAVGRANATNPICLIVPCHRVIGADGSLTGFAFGEAVKRQLLIHERVPAFAAA